jgi:hypothetical protein
MAKDLRKENIRPRNVKRSGKGRNHVVFTGSRQVNMRLKIHVGRPGHLFVFGHWSDFLQNAVFRWHSLKTTCRLSIDLLIVFDFSVTIRPNETNLGAIIILKLYNVVGSSLICRSIWTQSMKTTFSPSF